MTTEFPFTPLGTNMVVKRLEPQHRSLSGLLYLPDTAQEKQQFGEIIAAGPDLRPRYLRPGQVILFDKYTDAMLESGDVRPEIVVEGVKYMILRIEEILGVVTDPKTAQNLIDGTG